MTNGQSPAVVGGLTNDDLIDVPPLTARVSSAPRLTEDDLAEKMSAIGRDIGRKNTVSGFRMCLYRGSDQKAAGYSSGSSTCYPCTPT